jgi:drug/metabolite transporter (DMT)-like permease
MESGVLFGLTAALCWGVADFLARGATRTGGTFRTLLYIEIVATLALLLVGLPLGWLRLRHQPEPLLLLTVVLSLLILGGAALLYRAFAIGTLALVSPVAASFAAVTALLAILSGERPTPPQLLGIVLTLAGVVLVSTVPPHPTQQPVQGTRRGPLGLAPGLAEALAATLIFGSAYWGLRFVVGTLGGVTVAFIGKVSDLVVMVALTAALALLPAKPARSSSLAPRRRGPPPGFLALVVPTALLDTAANIAYNVGITTALTSVVAVLSSLFSAVTVLLAWVLLRERLTRWQGLGALAILVGIALVSV